MFYIFHGDEEFTCSEQIAKLKLRVTDEGMGDLNITELDGRTLTFAQLQDVCNTLPFLFSRRLVIVENLLQRFGPRGRSRSGKTPRSTSEGDKEFAQRLLDYLPQLPPTTRLVFSESQPLARSHPILKQALKTKDGYVQEFKALEAADLKRWIATRARQKGGEITPPATALLISFVGSNLRLLDQELSKLAAWTNWERPIEGPDVRRLVSTSYESNVFDMVDALGLRQSRHAIQQLQRLVENGANELYLLTMVARQIRLILAAKDLAETQRLSTNDIQRELHISYRFIVEKLLRQSRHFEIRELESILRRLLIIDEGIKTGKLEGLLSLELLVIEICAQGDKRGGSAALQEKGDARFLS